MPPNLTTATRGNKIGKRFTCSTEVSSVELITEITRVNTKISTSFEHIKKSIEESNTLLGQKKDSLLRASSEFMSSTIY